MKVPPSIQNTAERFNRMSLRERVLVFGALLAGFVVCGDTFLIQPVAGREQALISETAELNRQMSAAGNGVDGAPDATSVAQEKEQSLEASLAAVNGELAAVAAGLIPPQQIAQMLHEVLQRQRGIRLVSLHNEPVRSLVPAQPAIEQPKSEAPVTQGPFSHPIVMVVEGNYLDVLAYLRELESMAFRVYWNRLELETLEYPRNRVRIELSTLSMDQEWLGV
jgi:MSHA biogenesis protein MshJ